MWTKKNRRQYDRSGLRYPSDVTDGEWAQVEPLIPPAKRGGRRREVNLCEVLNGIFYVLPVAGVAQGSATEEHGARLFDVVGLGRNALAHSSHAVHGAARM